MNICDKSDVGKNRCCPPHFLPHKLPFGKRICDEHCHIHMAKWRMKHHSFFCKILKCPNYKFMVECSKNDQCNCD
jgi:hypothetical protein